MKTLTTGTALALVLLTGSLGLPAAPLDPTLLAQPGLLPPAPLETGLDGLVPGLDGLDPPAFGLPGADVPAAVPTWAPAATAQIRPGIQTYTGGSLQCTANFVFYKDLGAGLFDIYVGQAAHCASLGGATDVNGCTTPSMALNTPVDLGTGNWGTLFYSSWKTMQANGVPANDPKCVTNDFALVKVHELDEATVNPQVPHFGGPIGVLGSQYLSTGSAVMSYGNSGLRFGVEPVLSWKRGYVLASDAASTDVYTVTPGIPGDSGSGLMESHGFAVGVLSTVAVAPFPLSNQFSGLATDMAYASANGVTVQLGTAPLLLGAVLPDL